VEGYLSNLCGGGESRLVAGRGGRGKGGNTEGGVENESPFLLRDRTARSEKGEEKGEGWISFLKRGGGGGGGREEGRSRWSNIFLLPFRESEVV